MYSESVLQGLPGSLMAEDDDDDGFLLLLLVVMVNDARPKGAFITVLWEPSVGGGASAFLAADPLPSLRSKLMFVGSCRPRLCTEAESTLENTMKNEKNNKHEQ